MINIKTCSFFGHRDCRMDKVEKEKLQCIVENLIINHNVRRFLFGAESNFDRIAYDICLNLKMKYEDINLVYCRAKNPNPTHEYTDRVSEFFDETIYPPSVRNSGKNCYIVRNRYMIDESDYCIFYYQEGRNTSISKEYKTGRTIQTNSGTKIALEYAKNIGKAIINAS